MGDHFKLSRHSFPSSFAFHDHTGFFGCGDQAANMFCQSKGYARAAHYEKREFASCLLATMPADGGRVT